MLKKLNLLIWKLFKPMPLDNNFKDYNEYWSSRGFHEPSLGKAKIMSKYIDSNSTILDIGCGDGTVLDFLSQNNKPIRIIGIDISQRAVDYVKKKGFEAYKIDVLSDDFPKFLKNKTFDYIIMTEVLEHVQDPEKIILAIKNNFTKAIFVSIPNSGFILHRLRLLFGRFPLVMIQQNIKEHIRFWTLKDFIYWCGYFGLRVDSFFVSASMGIKPLVFLEKVFPGLFGCQILYKLSIKK
jgi:methionine biosynthesis protein MetW